MAQQVEVEVGHGHGVHARRHGVGLEITGARRVVQFGRQVHRQVGVRRVKRGAIAVLTLS